MDAFRARIEAFSGSHLCTDRVNTIRSGFEKSDG